MSTLVLSMKDGKLMGKLTTPGRQGGEATTADVTNAMVKDDTVSFEVERDFGGNKSVTKYTGKLAGDKITGTATQTPGRNGAEPMPRPWEATKSAK
ncbi:MAG: hypothetical protein ABIZ49_04260 [Opitutaceae bacterium]